MDTVLYQATLLEAFSRWLFLALFFAGGAVVVLFPLLRRRPAVRPSRLATLGRVLAALLFLGCAAVPGWVTVVEWQPGPHTVVFQPRGLDSRKQGRGGTAYFMFAHRPNPQAFEVTAATYAKLSPTGCYQVTFYSRPPWLTTVTAITDIRQLDPVRCTAVQDHP